MIYCFVKNIQSVKINTEALSVVSKKVDLGIIAVETKRTHVPRGQNVRQNFSITRGFETVAKCKIRDWHCQRRIA